MSIRNLFYILLFASTFCFSFDSSFTDYRSLNNLFSDMESNNKNRIYKAVEIYENENISPEKAVNKLHCTNVTKKAFAVGDLEYLVYSTLSRFPTKREHKAFQKLLKMDYKNCSNIIRKNGEVILEEYHFIASDNSAALYFRMAPIRKEN